ncbi:MAG: HzsA-related protein [Planctomycetota bacterium]
MERGRIRNYFYHRRRGAILLLLCICHCAASVYGSPPETSSVDQDLFRSDKGLARLSRLGIKQVVFATRLSYDDPHWYANIGYFCDDENHKAYAGNGKPDESKLYVLDTETGQINVLLDGKGGGIRDPHVHYDGRTVLFSYRQSGTDCYNLHEIQTDGTKLKQLTNGSYDDIEAMYLPTDDIVFVSTLSKRWVGCWKTQVGTLFRCDRQGKNIHPLSFNPEHDNTPAMLPDGRIIYTRWEYVDRSQVGYHQLWAMNPDGTNVVAYYGNQKHYPLYIDAKAIPGGDDVLVIDSPGHGRSDHRGHVCVITPRLGPDDNRGYRRIYGKAGYNDPYPINNSHFLVASYKQLILGTLGGESFPVLAYKGRANIHEPVPVYERPREKILADRTNPNQAAGRMILADVYSGRNMEGIQPGQIKKLLVVEALPKPVNFSGGMDLTSWLGTFMLERVLGTVPVEEDGSAYFEVPAGRTVLFVALDGNDLSVKRMQSFTNVQPGEVLSCVGCHEHRALTPASIRTNRLMAVRRPPSRIEPFEGLPDVLDYRRHIQPILNEHCVRCHNYKQRDGHVALTEDLGITWSLSYYMLIARRQVADGRNGYGNQKPRTIGSSASELMNKIDGSHYDVTLTAQQWRTIWMWLESGAPYAGTYAALRNGAEQVRQGKALGAFHSPVLNITCRQCHGPGKKATAIPYGLSDVERRKHQRQRNLAPHERIVRDEDSRFSAHVLLNVSRPDYSPMLLGPLAKSAGGWGTCEHQFSSKDDPQYQALLAAMQNGKRQMDKVARFGTTAFKPNRQYVREMKRFGVLKPEFNLDREPIDIFETDQRYWELFWYRPRSEKKWAFVE